MENGSGRVEDVLRDTCRAAYGRILSVVLRILGDLEDAEDVLQSAVERALVRWAERGIPSNPAAWLTTVAKRIAIDQIRRRRRKAAAEDRLIRASEAVGIRQREQRLLSEWPDERLGLMALCCSAALTPQDRAALTLREVAGLSVDEVARAFLVSEVAMTGRLSRARRKLRGTGAPSVDPAEIAGRLDDIHRVIYLIYSYDSREALRVAEILYGLLSKVPGVSLDETAGLLALMELDHARAPARETEEGGQILLSDQDRSRWDRTMISRALRRLDQVPANQYSGQYVLQARIHAHHALATSADETDWQGIDRLYQKLYRINPSPVIALNGIVAMGMWAGADPAVAALDALFRDDRSGARPPRHDTRFDYSPARMALR